MGTKVRRLVLAASCLIAAIVAAAGTVASTAQGAPAPALATTRGADRRATAAKPWCAPEVTELSDYVCYFDGGAAPSGRHTLVVYLHGLLAETPGFQYLQQRGMALHAKRLGFTVLLPTAPKVSGGYAWPTARTAQANHESDIVRGIAESRAELEARLGHRFDEVFVVGFSSGAYYGSSLALRGALDVDGYIVLAGGAAWAGGGSPSPSPSRRSPVFVGVSAADHQTADHSRAMGRSLAAMGWPYRMEERDAGHMVDWTFMSHGIAWLRGRAAGPQRSPQTN